MNKAFGTILCAALLLFVLPPAWVHTTAAPAQRAAHDYELGRQYRNGTGVARDSARAAMYLEAAARGQHAAAMFSLSNMLAAGEGVHSDPAAARRWLEAAAQLDYPEALQQLALHLQDGSLGYARDEARAAQLMRAMAHAMKHRVQEQ